MPVTRVSHAPLIQRPTVVHFAGFHPLEKPFSYRTNDIWRLENGKFAEHWDISEAEEVLRLRSD